MTPPIAPGTRFGRLTVAAFTHINAQGARTYSLQCDCGNSHTADGRNLKKGHVRSCGCLQAEQGRNNLTHGLTNTPEYKTWRGMRSRCNNPKASDYARYGGRGIKVCERWNSFASFLADMGHKPFAEASIERIDNNGNYEPGNCRWAMRLEQSANRDVSILIEANGERLTAHQWAKRIGASKDIIYKRLSAGWDPVRAVTTPSRAQEAHGNI